MTGDQINVTDGWIARHTPKGAGSGGRDAAIIDIAQDLLLRELHTRGALKAIVFKGGNSTTKAVRRKQRTLFARLGLQPRSRGRRS